MPDHDIDGFVLAAEVRPVELAHVHGPLLVTRVPCHCRREPEYVRDCTNRRARGGRTDLSPRDTRPDLSDAWARGVHMPGATVRRILRAPPESPSPSSRTARARG